MNTWTSGALPSMAADAANNAYVLQPRRMLCPAFLTSTTLLRPLSRRSLIASHRPAISMSTTATAPGAVVARTELSKRVRAAISSAFPDVSDPDARLTDATNKAFGDYQANAALGLSKALKKKPRDIAAEILERLDVADICGKPSVAGPGFINFTLKDEFVYAKLEAMACDKERLGIAKKSASEVQKVVVDFSSPNIAKDMHAGHLRSTIIGETLSRTLEFLGHDVLRLNHTGDWGTQFGQLITYMRDECPDLLDENSSGENAPSAEIGDLVEFYKAAKARFDSDPDFKARAQAEVVELQGGNEKTLKAWNIICDLSRIEFQKIYDRLSITLTERGESFYNPYLPEVLTALQETGLAVPDSGAQVVFLEGDQFKGRDGDPLPVIVQKSDGGFLYATTDLAAIRYRANVDKADRVLYVTDVGQSLHFQQVFQVARRAGFYTSSVNLEHVPFGLVQGEDGKKFKTRSGDTVKLVDLLDEAARRTRLEIVKRQDEDTAKAVEAGKEPPVGRSEEELSAISEHIGIAAVKYADLRISRTNNYKFSYDKMVALEGDTAPYILYAYARVQGIYRAATAEVGASEEDVDMSSVSFTFEKKEERELAKLLLQLPEVLAQLERDLLPHSMCEYIKSLTSAFNKYYEQCPVTRAPTEELKSSRMALCGITASALKLCLGLLGIETLDRI